GAGRPAANRDDALDRAGSARPLLRRVLDVRTATCRRRAAPGAAAGCGKPARRRSLPHRPRPGARRSRRRHQRRRPDRATWQEGDVSDFSADVYQNEFLPRGGTEVNAIVTVASNDAATSGGDAAEIVIVDVSGSMGGGKLRAAKEATVAAVDY